MNLILLFNYFIIDLIPRIAVKDHQIGEFLIKKGDYVDVNILGN